MNLKQKSLGYEIDTILKHFGTSCWRKIISLRHPVVGYFPITVFFIWLDTVTGILPLYYGTEM